MRIARFALFRTRVTPLEAFHVVILRVASRYSVNMTPVTLEREAFVLRPPSSGDIDAITEACQDPMLLHWVPLPVPYTRAHAEEFVPQITDAGWRNGTACTWVIERAGELAGMISLNDIGQGSASIGYWAARPHRGTGTVTAAGQAVLDFAFAPEPHGLGLSRVEWRAHTGNRATAAVAQRLGFTFEGIARSAGVIRGQRRDEWMAGLLSTDDRSPADWHL